MPFATDVKALRDTLADLRPDEPLRHGSLIVIPLMAGPAPEPDWLTLAEAGTAVVIEEVSKAGEVPALTVTNTAHRPVLLLDGEELVGAKQNRVLNTTVLVASGARLDIPVSCVEQGRWAYKSARFALGDATLYATARAKKAERLKRSALRGCSSDALDPPSSSSGLIPSSTFQEVLRAASSSPVTGPTLPRDTVLVDAVGSTPGGSPAIRAPGSTGSRAAPAPCRGQ